MFSTGTILSTKVVERNVRSSVRPAGGSGVQDGDRVQARRSSGARDSDEKWRITGGQPVLQSVERGARVHQASSASGDELGDDGNRDKLAGDAPEPATLVDVPAGSVDVLVPPPFARVVHQRTDNSNKYKKTARRRSLLRLGSMKGSMTHSIHRPRL